MRLLIYSGFNPRMADNFGQTPLHLACISGNLTSVQELCEQVRPKKINNMFLRHFFLENDAGGRLFIFDFFE